MDRVLNNWKPVPHASLEPKSCQRCGVLFLKSARSNHLKSKCCSVKCRDEQRHADKAARIAKFKCRVCGGPARGTRFTSTSSCSFACGQKLRQAKARTRRDATCKTCGKAFRAKLQLRGWEKYCSMPCWRLVKAHRPAMIPMTCRQCGTAFRRTFGAVKRVRSSFCSRSCSLLFNRGANNPLYRGESDPNRGGQWRRLAKKIRERDGYSCQRCNRTQQENGQKLSVDHIVPWRSFTDKAQANDPSNLVSLCRRCHSVKTNVYERLWLKGDTLGMAQYRKAIQLPPLFASVEIPT